MNELESKNDKDEVYNDVYSTINTFESDLPKGVKKLYRVDALPALKAQQERNILKMITSGIISFESTLLTIISLQKERINQTRLFRVISIASQVKSVLQKKANNLIKEIRDAEYIRNVAIEKGKQREEYLREEFKIRVKTYSNWLSLDMLLGSYQEKVAQALETRCFNNWQDSQFKSCLLYTSDAADEA